MGRLVGFLRFGKGVWAALLAWFVIQFAVGGLYSVLFNLYLSRLGMGVETIGLINMAAGLGCVLFSVPAGLLGSRWGQRNMVALGLGGGLVFSLLVPLLQLLPPVVQPPVAFLTYGILATFSTLQSVNTIPFLTGSSADETRVPVFTVFGAMGSLAGFTGGMLGGFLPEMVSRLTGSGLDMALPYGLPFLIMPLLSLVCLGLFLGWTRPEKKVTQALAAPSRRAPWGMFGVLAAGNFARTASQYALLVFFNLYLDGVLKMPTVVIGVWIALSRLLPVPFTFLTPLLTKRWGKLSTVLGFSVLMGLAVVPIGLFPGLLPAIVSLFLVGIFGAVANPSFTILHQELTPEPWRGIISGLASMAETSTYALLAFVGGFLIEALGYQRFFLVSGAFSLAGPLVLWAYFRNKRTV